MMYGNSTVKKVSTKGKARFVRPSGGPDQSPRKSKVRQIRPAFREGRYLLAEVAQG